jgi:hypothetical protein
MAESSKLRGVVGSDPSNDFGFFYDEEAIQAC